MRTFRAWAYFAGFEEYNSRNHPLVKRSAYLYARWTYKARYLQLLAKTFFPKHRILSRASNVAFSSPVSAVYTWNAWDHDPPFGEEICCILCLGLSVYGRPSKKHKFLKGRTLGPSNFRNFSVYWNEFRHACDDWAWVPDVDIVFLGQV